MESKEAMVAWVRAVLEAEVALGNISTEAADEVAVIAAEVAELEALGALTLEQGLEIMRQLADAKAAEYFHQKCEDYTPPSWAVAS
jgi:hypothetical protein